MERICGTCSDDALSRDGQRRIGDTFETVMEKLDQFHEEFDEELKLDVVALRNCAAFADDLCNRVEWVFETSGTQILPFALPPEVEASAKRLHEIVVTLVKGVNRQLRWNEIDLERVGVISSDEVRRRLKLAVEEAEMARKSLREARESWIRLSNGFNSGSLKAADAATGPSTGQLQ